MASSTEAELTLVIKAKNMASKEMEKLGTTLKKVRTGAGKLGKAFLNIGKVALIAAGAAVVAFGALLVKSTAMAADEEKGIARMNAALKANNKNHKISIATIEKVIAKREELAFTDDDLRASVTMLTAKYKDANKALRLQRTAMDLARLKGISLQDATLMLTKGLDGNAKVLKVLGIELPKTATKQQRLDAIMKVSAGQAEAYGKTAAGAQEAFQIATDDLMEDLGGLLLPVMKDVFTWLRTNALPAVRDIAGKVGEWMAKNKPLIEQMKGVFLTAVKTLAEWVGTLAGKIMDVLGAIGDIARAIGDNKEVMDGLSEWADQLSSKFQGLYQNISNAVQELKKLLGLQTKRRIIELGPLDPNRDRGLENPSNKGKGTFANTRRVPGPLGAPIRITAHGGEKVSDAGPEGRGARGGFTIQGVSEREILAMVDKGLYFKLRRAAPAGGRA